MTVKEIARFYKIPVERAFGNTGGYILEDVRRTKADATRRAKALRGDGLTRFARSPAEPGRPHDAGRALKTPARWQSDPWPRPGDAVDETRKAKLPGRRVAEKSGEVYYERRRNRSDMPWRKV